MARTVILTILYLILFRNINGYFSVFIENIYFETSINLQSISIVFKSRILRWKDKKKTWEMIAGVTA